MTKMWLKINSSIEHSFLMVFHVILSAVIRENLLLIYKSMLVF